METNSGNEQPGVSVAPAWHTGLLLLALLVVSVQAALSNSMSEWPRTLSVPGARSLLYLRIIALQWIWAAYVWFGVKRAGNGLRALIDDAPWTARRWLRYAAIGFAGLILWLILGAGLGRILTPSAEQLRGVQAMLPHTSAERLLWVGFALSATVCEELVYRGYLLRQFRALAGTRLLAVLLQAVIYGCAHLSLPIEMVVSIGLLGALLGALAVWQRSLVPSMLLHLGTGLIAIVGSPASQ